MSVQIFNLVRDAEQSVPDTTIGELFLDGEHFAYTCEDLDRKLEVNLGLKVYGKTAIPRGKYKLVVTMSNRFKRLLPLLINVPGFEGVRIHGGNTHENTEGCILVGKQKTSAGIRDCAERVDTITKLIKNASDNNIESWMIIE